MALVVTAIAQAEVDFFTAGLTLTPARAYLAGALLAWAAIPWVHAAARSTTVPVTVESKIAYKRKKLALSADVVGPQVNLTHARHPANAAWLEGDYGPTLFPVRTFTSRVAWVELPQEVSPVDFVPEGFKESFAKLVGGSDVDVESYDFNRRWRVKAQSAPDAHAMLQPLLIQFLNDVKDPHLAFHVDGKRVLIWDDGSDPHVDLDARVDLLKEFVDCLPAHLRT